MNISNNTIVTNHDTVKTTSSATISLGGFADSDLITKQELCQCLGCSERTIQRMVDRFELPPACGFGCAQGLDRRENPSLVRQCRRTPGGGSGEGSAAATSFQVSFPAAGGVLTTRQHEVYSPYRFICYYKYMCMQGSYMAPSFVG